MSSESGAQELLDTAKAAARTARRARQAFWFPLLAFGAVAAGASPFYVEPAATSGFGVVSASGSTLYLGGFSPTGGGSAGAQLYWTLALAGGYVAVVLFYRLHARRAGVAGRIWPPLAAGAGALLLLLLTGGWMPGGLDPDRFLPLDFFIRGMVPLVVIGIGVVALAWSERSRGLLAFGLCFLALAAVANLYDTSNLLDRAGWILSYRYEELPNLLAPALMLLLGGAGFLLRARLRRR
jgi:hypothetical protein